MDEDEPIQAPAWATVKRCNRIQWCTGMKIALGATPENSLGKGLSVSLGYRGNEARPRVIGITYHAKARDQGIILNLCPWCGASIRFDEAIFPPRPTEAKEEP